MRITMTLAEYKEARRQENLAQQRVAIASNVQKSLENNQRQTVGEQGKQFAKSIAEQATGAPKNGSIRSKLQAPKGTRWGGLITTDRDAQYCACGHTIIDHLKPEHATCSCKWKP